MEELMQEGGMADDGMSQEPVTGNDIPPGALASEVRDDVDAKLSEGEYVVSADVVRYFGVSFFEGLRTKAKEGLSDMEANGRIGGTPVDAEGVPAEDSMDELSPEEEQMLQQALGSTGMAEGGDVVGFDRTKFTLTPNDTSGFGTSAVTETRQYFNPTTGKKASVQFMDGMALGAIPAGFVPWSQTLEDSYNTTKPAPRESSSDNSSSDNTITTTGGSNSSGASFDYTKWADTNADAINSNPYEFGMKALEDKSGNLTNKAIGIAGLATGLLPLAMLGAGLGAANKLQNVAEANAALKIMDSRGLTDSPEYQALAGKVKEYISDLPLAQQGAIATKVAATGNQYIEAIEAKSGTTTAPTTMTSAPTQRTPVQQNTAVTPKPTAKPSASGNSGSGGGGADRMPVTAAAKPAVNTVRPTVNTAAAKPTTTTKVVSTPAGNKTVTVPKPVVSQASRNGLVGGGLVTKPKKITPKSKGLGGKQ